jgi:hypothetical protein
MVSSQIFNTGGVMWGGGGNKNLLTIFFTKLSTSTKQSSNKGVVVWLQLKSVLWIRIRIKVKVSVKVTSWIRIRNTEIMKCTKTALAHIFLLRSIKAHVQLLNEVVKQSRHFRRPYATF